MLQNTSVQDIALSFTVTFTFCVVDVFTRTRAYVYQTSRRGEFIVSSVRIAMGPI